MNPEIVLVLAAVPEGRMFALDQQTLISTIILLANVGILALVLGKLLYKPVQEYMRRRTEKISSQLEEAQNRLAQADALKAEYEAKMQEIAAERARSLEAARIEAAERSRQMMEEAQHEVAVLKQRTAESIQVEKERLKRDSRQHIVEISALMTEKLVRKTIDRETHERLFDEALAELEEAPWPN